MVYKSLQTLQLTSPIEGLDRYIQQVNSVPLLSADQERELARRWQQEGAVDCARELVLAHLRFVVRIARDYRGYGLAVADLIQEGNVGLMKAVKRFDPSIGVRLAAYAVHWIKSEIHDFIIRNWRIVKVATTKAQRKLFFNLRKAKKRLGWFSEKEVNDLADDLGVSTNDVIEMESRLHAHDAAYDEPAQDEPYQLMAPSAYLTSQNADWAHDDWKNVMHCQLQSAISALSEREAMIVKARWLGEEKATLQQLAGQLGISLERVRQIEKTALQKLRALMEQTSFV